MRVRASGSFRRYAIDPRGIEGGLQSLRDEAGLAKRLHAQRFRSIDHAGSEISSAGWSREDGRSVSAAREFAADDPWLGISGKSPVLALALRIDRKRLPPGALRVRRMESEAAERRGVGERIAPARRREIAEKIEAELTVRVVPATSLHTMLWQVARGELLFSATADPANTSFRALFRETFGGALEPLITATLVPRLAGRLIDGRLGELAPAAFVDGADAGGAGEAREAGEAGAFLGREWLLWLWHQCETAGGKFELSGPGVTEVAGEVAEVGIAFDQLLELAGRDAAGEAEQGGRITLRGDAPTRAPEAASALLSGRLPLRARLVIARGERTFEVTLAADSLDLDSVKVSADAEEITDEHLRSGDEQRANWLFELSALIDALFSKYLELRFSRAFTTDALPSLRDWIVSRSRPRSRAAAR